jgi:hypothetical protein
MSSKYHQIKKDVEKFLDVDPHRLSTSESLAFTLLDSSEEEEEEEESGRAQWIKLFSRCIWLGHVVLLSLAVFMFALSYFTRLSTLRHVQQFSAYCKSVLSQMSQANIS